MTPRLCYAVEPVTRVVRGKVYTRYRWVQYRVSNGFDGQPVYLRKGRAARTDASLKRAAVKGYEEASGKKSGYRWVHPIYIPASVVDNDYRLLDAKDGEPVTERDALKFLPDMTHGMAALDKLRDLLTEEV